jgi:hypothetical protein
MARGANSVAHRLGSLVECALAMTEAELLRRLLALNLNRAQGLH